MAAIGTDNPRGIEVPDIFNEMELEDREVEVENVAKKLDLGENEICVVCLAVIKVAIFRGTGVCCDDHRKLHLADLARYGA